MYSATQVKVVMTVSAEKRSKTRGTRGSSENSYQHKDHISQKICWGGRQSLYSSAAHTNVEMLVILLKSSISCGFRARRRQSPNCGKLMSEVESCLPLSNAPMPISAGV